MKKKAANYVHVGGEIYCLKCRQEIVKRWKDGKCKKHGCKLHEEPDPRLTVTPWMTVAGSAGSMRVRLFVNDKSPTKKPKKTKGK